MKVLRSLIFASVLICFLFYSLNLLAQPKGAKAIFDSGEGPAVVSSVSKKSTTSTPVVEKEKYVGIAYQIMLLSSDGSFKPVLKARTFRSGERVKLIVRTNRPGYMTIMNIGPTGNTNILFNDHVEAFTFHEIPKNTNLVFTGAPGTERLLIMLSDNPNPIVSASTGGNSESVTVQEPASAYPTSTPTCNQIVTSLRDASKGAKDIVVEDSMKSNYAIISPQNGYKPVQHGMKDIMLESSGGYNYGVVPVTAISNGGILTLEIKLKHL